MRVFNLPRFIISICFGISILVIAACSGAAPAPTLNPADYLPVSSAKITVTPLMGRMSAQTVYLPSDPALVEVTGKPQVIEFYASWCTTCAAMRPIIHELHDEYNQVADFIYLDIDAPSTKELQSKFGFDRNLRPTFIFINSDGDVSGRMIGQHSKEEVRTEIEKAITAG